MTAAAASEAAVLVEQAATLGSVIQRQQANRLLRYLDLLYSWNRTAGLTTIERADAPRLHLLDSLSLSPWIMGGSSVVDLGSGAGLPGIPLAIVHGDVEFSLVESNRRRCSFLAEVVREIGLDNVSVLEVRADRLAGGEHRFGHVVSRAFRGPLEFVGVAAGILAPGGRVLVMGGRLEDATVGETIASFPELRLEDDRSFTLPGGDEQRRILVLRS